jgi:hypothetical protein
MTRRHSSRSVALVALVVAAASLVGCRIDRSPRRVPGDGAPCSAVMPGAPTSGETTFRLDSVVVIERAWGLLPPEVGVDPPKDVTMYSVRRATVPAGAALRDAALLDAAAARVARGIELGAGTKPTVEKVATSAGGAVDLRYTTGTFHSATRLLLIPGGFCEVTIMGAHTEAEVRSYLASAQIQGRP